jgi:hypothetical protein
VIQDKFNFLWDFLFEELDGHALPYKWIHSKLKNLNLTEREGKSHWRIILNPDDAGTLTLRLKSGQNEQLEDFKILLPN